jgi:hypothetical protein
LAAYIRPVLPSQTDTNENDTHTTAPRLSALTIGVLAMLAGTRPRRSRRWRRTRRRRQQRGGQRPARQPAQRHRRAREADNIVSVISSDDIGGLPDKNAAEALARLPGVAVQRDQGEGRYVSVRGLGPDLNAVTINGALVPSPESGRRAVALDVLPAGLIRTLEVSKTLTRPRRQLAGRHRRSQNPDRLRPAGQAAVGHHRRQPRPEHRQDQPERRRAVCRPLPRRQTGRGRRPQLRETRVRLGQRGNRRRLENGKLAGVEFRDYLPTRERRAAALNLDYHPDSASKYFLRSFISDFSDDEVRDRLTISNIAAAAWPKARPPARAASAVCAHASTPRPSNRWCWALNRNGTSGSWT